MKWWNLTTSEIRFRPGGFIIGIVAAAAAAGSVAGAVALLRAHDIETEKILQKRERETRQEMMRLEDDMRKIMRELGYNVMILHENQNLAALRNAGHPDTYMPEEYAGRLGQSGITTLNHLLPVLQQKAVWPETGMQIILSGTPGQAPVLGKPGFLTPDKTAYLSPMTPAVPENSFILGSTVAKGHGLKVGDTVKFMNEKFRIERVNPPEGNLDDIIVWCGLEKAQKWLGLEGKINLILALECVCDAGQLGRITEEVRRVLPDVQVLEFSSRVSVRAGARGRAADAHKLAVAGEMAHRAEIAGQIKSFTSVLVPLAAAGAMLWIFFLAFGNARERKSEIGILRAMGVRESPIAAVFLLKAAMIGLLGALAGCAAGTLVAGAWAGFSPASGDFFALLNAPALALVLAGAPALCIIASLGPALWAARLDPAVALRED